MEIEWENQLRNRALKYIQFKSVRKDQMEQKRSTTSPAESSVINQLRVSYALFWKALPFFFGVLQVVLKIKLEFN